MVAGNKKKLIMNAFLTTSLQYSTMTMNCLILTTSCQVIWREKQQGENSTNLSLFSSGVWRRLE